MYHAYCTAFLFCAVQSDRLSLYRLKLSTKGVMHLDLLARSGGINCSLCFSAAGSTENEIKKRTISMILPEWNLKHSRKSPPADISAGGLFLILFFRRQLIHTAHIHSERFGYCYRAVCMQVIFQITDQHAGRGDNRIV